MLMLRLCGARSRGSGVEAGLSASIEGESRECSGSLEAQSLSRWGFLVALTATTTNARMGVGIDHLREDETLVAA